MALSGVRSSWLMLARNCDLEDKSAFARKAREVGENRGN